MNEANDAIAGFWHLINSKLPVTKATDRSSSQASNRLDRRFTFMWIIDFQSKMMRIWKFFEFKLRVMSYGCLWLIGKVKEWRETMDVPSNLLIFRWRDETDIQMSDATGLYWLKVGWIQLPDPLLANKCINLDDPLLALPSHSYIELLSDVYVYCSF